LSWAGAETYSVLGLGGTKWKWKWKWEMQILIRQVNQLDFLSGRLVYSRSMGDDLALQGLMI